MNQLRDEYGNPVRQTDESGTMGASDTGTGRHGEGGLDAGAVGYDQTMGGTGHGAQGIGTGHGAQGIGTGRQGGSYDDTGTGALRRTGSSGSSSSEDDGQGGRRKKGMKEKIKEKLPGGHNKQQGEYGRQTGQGGHYKQGDEYGTANTTSGIGQDAHGHQTGHEQTEKTGIMGKIKDVLPGKN